MVDLLGAEVGFTSSLRKSERHIPEVVFSNKFFVFFSGLEESSLRLLCRVIVLSDVLFNCVKDLISCSHLSISALLLKSLERSPH